MGFFLLLLAFALGLAAVFNLGGGMIALSIACIATLAMSLYVVPREQAKRIQREMPEMTPQERFKVENDARDMLAKTLGGLGILLTLFTSVQQMQQASITQRLSLESAATERLYKATEKLSSPHGPERLGALADLQRMVGESSNLMPVAVSALCGYVRDTSYTTLFDAKGEPRDSRFYHNNADALDVKLTRTGENSRLQEILNTFAERPDSSSDVSFDLSHVSLAGKRFALLPARKSFATSQRMARWSGADFTESDLTDAHFEHCDLRGANFKGARLFNAHFNNADLSGAIFEKADDTLMDVTGAKGINRALLAEADGKLETVKGL